MEITLIRHLPTDWNQQSLLQGQKDILISPVTSNQKALIDTNIKFLQNLPKPDIILSSTLKRTQQTAELYGFHPEIESLLDEWNFGDFEGQRKEKLIETYQDIWQEKPREIVLGESGEQLEQRVSLFLKKYQIYNHVLVFGHGAWIRAFVSYVKNGSINDMNKMKLENNECMTIQYFNT